MWLEQQFTFGGKRRAKRWQNGWGVDNAFSDFVKAVGISQKPITANTTFTAVATYMKDFFPEFLKRSPFDDSEYFSYPYKHVTLDHLCFVYLHHERMEMLQYAEENGIRFFDFANWAVNQALCYNDEMGEEVYVVAAFKYMWPYLKPKERVTGRNDKFFEFDE